MIYLYKNPETGEIKEIVQGMNDVHEYEEDGVEWNRVFTVPQASIDTKIDPFSKNAFIDKTRNNSTMGDMWDRSRELSDRRAQESGEGVDPVKQKYIKDYKKKRGGKDHPSFAK